MKHFTLETDKDGIALITFDSPGRSMNVLSGDVIVEIGEIVEKITNDEAIKGAVFTSGKAAFCAGADLEEMGGHLASVQTLMKKDPEAAKKQLFEKVYKLNETFRAMETCGKPVAAAINGLALGGGLNLVWPVMLVFSPVIILN